MKPSRSPTDPKQKTAPASAAILVVDDNPANLVALEVSLKDLGYPVVLANSGSEGLKRLQETDCACVLLDVRMEGIDGFETAALIRKRERWAALPILFITSGEPSLLDYSQGYALGAVDFVIRPIDPEILKGKVKAVAELYVDRQRAQQEKEEAGSGLRERLGVVADSVPALISYIDRDGRYVYVNKAYEEWFGRSRDEIQGKHLREVLGEAGYEKIRSKVEEAISGKTVTYEAQVPYKDGGARFISASYSPHVEEGGHVAGFVALVNDISERRRREDVQSFLAETGALLSASLDPRETLETVARLAVPRMADWCVVDLLSEHGSVERVRMVHEDPSKLARATEYMKARPVSLSETHGIGAVLKAGQPELVPWIPDLAAESGSWHPEDARLIADLGLRSVLIVPLLGRERILGAITFLSAESGRRYGSDDLSLAQELAKRAALALENAFLYRRIRELNSQLASLVDERTRELADSRGRYEVLSLISPVGIFQTDAGGDWLEVNRRWTEITGLDAARSLGKGWAEALHPEDRERVGEEWYRAVREGRPFQSEYRFIRPDGIVTWVLGQATELKSRGAALLGYIGTVTDITERKEKEEAILLAGAELSSANRELEAFAYSVAHDLRTPLRTMVGMSQILLEDFRGKTFDEAAQTYASRIVATGLQMDQLTQDLLAYARVSRGEVELESLDPSSVVEDVVQDMSSELAARMADVRRGGLPGPVLGNRILLKQVFSNLLYNAIKFVRPGVAPRVAVAGEDRGKVIRIWVSDNGIGIAPEEQSKLFRLFERLQSRERYPGTGLGLALVKRAIERLGGRVGFEAESGGGSRFWFELPKA